MTLQEKIEVLVKYIEELDENEKRVIRHNQHLTYEQKTTDVMFVVSRLDQKLKGNGIFFGENNKELLWNFLRLFATSNFESGKLSFGDAMRLCYSEKEEKDSKLKKIIDAPDLLTNYMIGLLKRQINYFYTKGLDLDYTVFFYDIINWKNQSKFVQINWISDFIKKNNE